MLRRITNVEEVDDGEDIMRLRIPIFGLFPYTVKFNREEALKLAHIILQQFGEE